MRRAEAMALRVDAPYEGMAELAGDICLWLDALLAHAYARDAWVGRNPEMRDLMGLVVPREEFEEKLGRAGDLCALGPDDAADEIDAVLRIRLQRPDCRLPYARAARALALAPEEEKALRLALAATLDAKYEKLFAYLQDDVTRTQPSLRLFARLCGAPGELTAALARRVGESTRLAPLLDVEKRREGILAPSAALLRALLEDETDAPAAEPALDLHPAQTEALRRLCQGESRVVALLCGPAGCGRRTALRRAAGQAVALCAAEDLQAGIAQAALTGARLCVDCAQGGLPDLSALPEGLLPLFLLAPPGTALPLEAALPQGCAALRLEFGPPGDEEREALFRLHAGARGVQGPAERLAAKFFFLPGRIGAAMAAARARQESLGRALNEAELHEACYDVLEGDGAVRQESAGGSLEDLVLPEAQKRQLRQAVDQVLLRRTVYDTWGFAAGTPYGRGVSILLSGPPGTGKTMAATLVARELHMRLHVVQLSQVISKYVGETEKNLRRAFARAAEASAVLFFDECDALFGKRAEVRDAQDRHANAEVAFLLKQMEEHDGVTLLATNLSQNLDAAFLRRMRFVVHFPFPDAAARQELLRRLLPPGAPVAADVDFAFLAEKFALAGGNLKNIALHAAFLAAKEGGQIAMKHLLRAAVYEQRKNEIVVVREDLRQYEDLLEDESPRG